MSSLFAKTPCSVSCGKKDDTVRGYIMFRQSNLSQTQEDQVTTWTQGKFDRASVMAALRKLEKVQRERGGGKHYLTADDEAFEEYESEGEGDYIYLGEEDLEQVFEEEERTEALATYQQVRQAIREQRNGRGYFQPKGVGKQVTGKASKGSKSCRRFVLVAKAPRFTSTCSSFARSAQDAAKSAIGLVSVSTSQTPKGKAELLQIAPVPSQGSSRPGSSMVSPPPFRSPWANA